jgi:hypothetical protein
MDVVCDQKAMYKVGEDPGSVSPYTGHSLSNGSAARFTEGIPLANQHQSFNASREVRVALFLL